MKRLTIITNTLTSFGGGEKWALEVATRLKHNFDIMILSPTARKSLERRSAGEISSIYDTDGIKIESIDSSGIGSSAFGSDKFLMVFPKLRGMKRLASAISASDTIYMLSFNPFLLSFAVAMSRVYNKKLILGIHNPTFYKLFDKSYGIKQKTKSGLMVSVLKQVKYFHVLTEEDKNLVQSRFPEAHVYHIPLFIYQKPRIETNTKQFIVVMVGNLEISQKGIDILAKVVEATLSKNKNIVFHIVGKGGKGEQIVEKLMERYKDNFRWLGFASDDELDRERRAASLAISTSRYETFPAVLMDASSYGLPIVSFKIKGATTVVKEKYQGTLIRPFDIKAFSSSILSAYETWKRSGASYRKLKKRISDRAMTRFGEKPVIKELAKIME